MNLKFFIQTDDMQDLTTKQASKYPTMKKQITEVDADCAGKHNEISLRW